MSQENIDVVLASIDALNAGDLDAQMATYAPDAVIVFDPAGEGSMVLPDRLVGREPLRRELKAWQEALGFRYRASEVRAVGDHQVLCRGKLGGTGVASGIEAYDSMSTLFTLRHGLITRLEFHREHNDALKAAGLEEQAMSQNVEIVRNIYEAFAQRDGVTPFRHYAPDIEWDNSGGVELVGGSTVYHGHDGVHALFHDVLQAFREFEYRPLEFTPIGDHVLVAVHEHAVGRMSSVVVDRRHYAVWTLHNGMVIRVRVYLDHTDALKAAGLTEQAVSQANVEAIRRGFHALRVGGVEALLPFFTTDVVMHPFPEWPDDPV